MKLSVHHRTSFAYSEPARDNVNEVRLCPTATASQETTFFVLKVIPATRLRCYSDLYGNPVHYFEITSPHSRLVVDSHAVVAIDERIDYDKLPYGTAHAILPELRENEECCEFLLASKFVSLSPEVWREALDIKEQSKDVFETAYLLMASIFDHCKYLAGVTDATTSSQQVFEQKSGVCQDFAHLMLAYCRALGIPARYVSGYLWDPGVEDLRGSQASHAWVEIYLPGSGWVGLDPTNNKVVNHQYIVLATGRDYADVAPVRGTFMGGGHHHGMEVHVKVTRAGGGD